MDLLNLSNKSKALLNAVAKHSNNQLCKKRAEMYLNPLNSGVDLDMIKHIARGEGSFMTYCLKGDYKKAFYAADSSNRAALDTLKLEDLI